MFLIAPGLHLVDWRRGQASTYKYLGTATGRLSKYSLSTHSLPQGDLLSYHAFYREQRGRLGALVQGAG